MQEQASSILSTSSGGAREQVILPTRVATRICVQGLRTRLGRSIVTLLGVALGIAFLMAVLSGFHIKQAMREESQLRRSVERRLAVLRSEAGRLKDKSVLVAGAPEGELDAAFLDALRAEVADVTHLPAAPAQARLLDQARALVLLGNVDDALRRVPGEGAVPERVFAYDTPSPEAVDAARAKGLNITVLGIELRPEDLARMRLREKEALYRTGWIVIVSLLITVGSITNALLMSVAERFREIGTMKCLGALSGFVVKLFLIESSLVGLAGSLLGALGGVLLPLLAYGYSFGFGTVLTAVHLPSLLGYAAGCTAIGVVLAVVAGIYPARVAAKMIPAMALATDV